MKATSYATYETERIAALRQLEILDTEAEEDFDDIVALASQICETPIAVISFVDTNRSWFKAKTGIECSYIPRNKSFSAKELEGDRLMIVPDCSADERFTKNQFVDGENGIRFFAGMPLINEDGFTLGYLCVLDRKPRTLSSQQLANLRILGKQVITLLKLRLQIIKLKKAEEDSRNSEEQMNTIFHQAVDAVIVTEDTGRILQWNPKAEKIFGWKAHEVMGRYFHETIIPKQYRDQYLKWMTDFDTSNSESAFNNTVEISALRKDNSALEIALGISSANIKGSRHFICFASDITDRKFAAKELDKQKEFYENILNSLPIDIAVFDANHRYLFVNPGAIKGEEYRKFIIGKDDFEYCDYRKRDRSLAELRRARFLEVKKSKKEIRWEDTVNDPGGNPVTSLRRIFPVLDENEELSMVIGFGLDITDRKVMEEKQTALVKQLSAQNSQLVDFCNIVSHNLRAPLVNMSMLVEFIEESNDEAEQKQLISKLNPVLENLHTTFNELVESIQIRQDLEVKSEKILLKDYLRRTLEVLKVEINKSEAIIEFDFSEAQTIYYPVKYLYSILHNLVSNALKYQSPKRKPLIKLETKRVDGDIILSVSDNGLGIDMTKHKDNLFKIGRVFHRHPNAKGFGLFMTKTQVEAMEGDIWVESMPDVGSTFFVKFKKQNL
jgi:PAS domain S-box-containing protein